MTGAEQAALTVRDLSVRFAGSPEPAVRDVSFAVGRGEVLGVAGESGSGKSSIALAALGLLPPDAEVTGSIRLDDQELVGLRGRRLRAIRGRRVAMIFQESVSALHPMRRVGDQIVRVVRAHLPAGRSEARQRAAAALRDVRLDPDRVLDSYPHQLSGGMCQRVMIAMALSCEADVVLADEPTTALDVSLQKDILVLIRELVAARGLSAVFISHDLGVLGDVSDRVMVLYRGEVKEIGAVDAMLSRPRHPYSQALLDCVPRLGGDRLRTFPEITADRPGGWTGGGCNYAARCPRAADDCREHPALRTVGESLVRCRHPLDGTVPASSADRAEVCR
ncbi:ABC transporter ATP-binding protein [Micromonospora sp. WMMD1128]|uniref:ABC transporter ATP-binding protein n=1 Tax=unclassified Micromonospora TaxID=2617518 RepID=UPI00248BD7D2|nr:MULTISPECIES: ABC transporter ATP-binding protein [unclassified Micromonospora]WBB75768.1 ABC transporter ATP-binding protein [Micromonospora sp. WMMD1128]WFE36442.1 ABC transporter ATP-binding protein [Micromonospora sp. WMMD975]